MFGRERVKALGSKRSSESEEATEGAGQCSELGRKGNTDD
jgi:hypothetical protein